MSVSGGGAASALGRPPPPLSHGVAPDLTTPASPPPCFAGSPPKRLQKTGDENITEILANMDCDDIEEVSKSQIKRLEKEVVVADKEVAARDQV